MLLNNCNVGLSTFILCTKHLLCYVLFYFINKNSIVEGREKPTDHDALGRGKKLLGRNRCKGVVINPSLS